MVRVSAPGLFRRAAQEGLERGFPIRRYGDDQREVPGREGQAVAQCCGRRVRRYVAQKKHCSNLAADAVRAAIEDYWSKRKGAKDEGDQPEG